MSRAMRAGHTFITALGMVAEELPEPIAAEFKLLHDQQNFGMPLNEALREFGERVPLLTAKFFVTAILTQRESGGTSRRCSTISRRSFATASWSCDRCASRAPMAG